MKHGNDIWRGVQFTRNRARSQWPSATTSKQSTMNDEAFTCAYDFDGSRAVLVHPVIFLEGRLRECDNPAMSRLEMPFGYGALAVVY